MVSIIIAGATGWVGKALVAAVSQSSDLKLVGAVSRAAAGRRIGEATGGAALGVITSATLHDALAVPRDVLAARKLSGLKGVHRGLDAVLD
jgi:4-hydroxy-tetrahydrodipicolinate reductase